ncbi:MULTISPECIES: T9SS type A sorting domain-containing protein [Niastella]|uniref:T9SS type A sorting domain-containing protein n=1 Tax=Niastella soli TaxID=2821487 RepID=A0ABS3YMF9_9BACT|nr:T9SS type A sorting domain-containing protein [Niastella soli]MBO9199084.1 T9SS type A sorting domain-containing protein [Niastella soli]
MKALFVTLLTLLTATSLMATIKFSTKDDDWETGGTWNAGTKPVSNDTIVISAGDTVTVNSNINNLNHVVIIVYGLLDLTNNGKLDLDNTSKIFVQTGGKIIGDGNSDKIKIGSEIWNGSDPPVVGPKYADGGSGGFQPWVVLAVSFQSFYVIRQGVNIQIFWSTSEEVNNAYYAIEKSTDGKSWKQVATVAGAGTSAAINRYTYTDKNVTDAVAYYRLRQVDKNGAAYYSTVRAVRYNEATVANIYASSNKTVVVDFNSEIKDNVSIQLINMSGQVIVRKEFSQASYRLVVNAMSAGSGVYAVRVSDSKGWSEVKKIAL